MQEIVSYLEMTDPAELSPARSVPEVVLERAAPGSGLIRSLTERIGAPYLWQSVGWTDERWAQWLADNPRESWIIRCGAEAAGLAEFEPQAGGNVEINSFGLVPEFVGKGIGGYALTLTLRRAWEIEPLDTPTVRRIWLHTSTLDHPAALPNYEKRGLRIFRTETRQAPQPPPAR